MLKPLNGKAIVKQKKNDKTESGLVITGNADAETLRATVCEVSKYYDKSCKIENNLINVGDTILMSKFSGSKIEYEQEEYIVLDIDSILAVIKGE